MIKLLTISATQLSPAAITISWTFESTSEDFNNYRLHVYQAQSPASLLSEYDCISSGINPALIASIQDTTVAGATDKFVNYFYRILVSGIAGQGTWLSEPYGIAVQADKYATEISRRRDILFKYHSSQKFYLLKRRHYGTLCPICYDETLGRTTQSKCTTCYDTGYINGYYAPVSLLGQINERPTREMHQLFGAWQDQDAVLYIQADPSVNPKDIFVDRIYRRWVVLNVGAFQKAMHTIGQIVQLRQIERDDVIYQYPISI